MRRKLSALLVFLILSSLLAACGSNTATSPAAPATTAAGAAATTGAAAPAATTAPARPATPTPTIPPPAATPLPTLAATVTNDKPLTALGPIPAPPADAKKGGTVTLANSGDLPKDLHPNPVTASYTAAWGNVYNIIWSSTLLEFNFTTLEWQLALAKDVKITDEGKTYTFTLRPDLKWSDGSPITVDDFQFTYDNIRKENKDNPAAIYAGIADKRAISDVKTDATAGTIVVTFPKAYNRDLAFNYLNVQPMPKKIWDGKPFYDASANPEMKSPTVVNGPYMIESYDATSQGVFKPNPYWFRGKPNFDKVILKPFGLNVLGEALKTGQADAALNSLPTAYYEDLKNNPDLSVYQWYGVQNDLRYIAFNTTAWPFNDKTLRVAINYVVDRNTSIKLAENGQAVPQYVFVYDVSPFFNQEVPRYGLDIEKGKKMLLDGGYKLDNNVLTDKDGKQIKATLIYASSDTGGKLFATYLQQQMKQIGIDISVEAKEPTAFSAAIVTHKYDVSTGYSGGGLYPDPDSRKNYYSTGAPFNTSGYSSARIDEIFDKGATELDNAKRKALYDELQMIMTTNNPYIVVYSRILYVAAKKNLGGIVPHKGSTLSNNHAIAQWYWKS